MERLRSIKITIEIDTNKQTYSGEFESIEDAVRFYNSHQEITGEGLLRISADEQE